MFYPPRNTILAIALVCNTPAAAHDWYDFECCRKDHCHPVARDTLEQLDGGCWRYKPNSTVYCDNHIKASKDDGFHVCFSEPAWWNGRKPDAFCVYVPGCC